MPYATVVQKKASNIFGVDFETPKCIILCGHPLLGPGVCKQLSHGSTHLPISWAATRLAVAIKARTRMFYFSGLNESLSLIGSAIISSGPIIWISSMAIYHQEGSPNPFIRCLRFTLMSKKAGRSNNGWKMRQRGLEVEYIMFGRERSDTHTTTTRSLEQEKRKIVTLSRHWA